MQPEAVLCSGSLIFLNHILYLSLFYKLWIFLTIWETHAEKTAQTMKDKNSSLHNSETLNSQGKKNPNKIKSHLQEAYGTDEDRFLSSLCTITVTLVLCLHGLEQNLSARYTPVKMETAWVIHNTKCQRGADCFCSLPLNEQISTATTCPSAHPKASLSEEKIKATAGCCSVWCSCSKMEIWRELVHSGK